MVKSLLKSRPSVDMFLSIEYLENNQSKINNITMKDKRNVKILFLDDQGFDTEILIKLGYLDIHKEEKFERMDDFEKYDIIFCDINGVAKELDEVYQGAALAKLIKETYPSKIVVIFSAKHQSLSFHKYSDYVDDIILKNLPNSEIAEKIDEYIKILTNPIQFWKNMRKQLLNQKVSMKTIALLEHYYVKSILERKNYSSEIEKEKSAVSIESIISIFNSVITAIDMYSKLSGGQ